MSFTDKNNQTITENQTTGGIGSTIANFAPLIMLALEQFLGQPIPQAKGTLADILTHLQRIDAKLDSLEHNCSQQFIHQEKQLNSLLTNTNPIQDFRHLLEGKEIKFIKN